jgi:hypothetical protein
MGTTLTSRVTSRRVYRPDAGVLEYLSGNATFRPQSTGTRITVRKPLCPSDNFRMRRHPGGIRTPRLDIIETYGEKRSNSLPNGTDQPKARFRRVSALQ